MGWLLDNKDMGGFTMNEGTAVDKRTCTCHPDDRPEPCQQKYATSHCWRAAVYNQAREAVICLKNKDRTSTEQAYLNFLMRVERALDRSF